MPRGDDLLHPPTSDEPRWKFLPLVLGLAFAARAAVALSGDFVLHPDEIMQYLEPSHRLAFGNGVVAWEYFYGARSWLVPGAVAGVLKLFHVVGLGEPFWYVGGVKLFFCALSLAVPAGMYVFARRHFNEMAARAALLAGAFWYELVCFAHKPMTEFVATGLLMVLLALCVHPATNRPRTVWLVALLAVLAAATRVQYAPLALVLLGLVFLRIEKKWQMTVAVTVFFLATGLFDIVTWNLAAGSFGEAAWERGLFHSYLTNIRVNFALGESWQAIHPAWQYLLWLLYTGAGLSLLCAAGALREPRRYGLLLSLIALVLLLHSLQAHEGISFHLRRHPALASDRRGPRGPVCDRSESAAPVARSSRRGGWCRFTGRNPGSVAASEPVVSGGLRTTAREAGLRRWSGPRFCRLPLSCPHARGCRGSPPRSLVLRHTRLLLSAPIDTVL